MISKHEMMLKIWNNRLSTVAGEACDEHLFGGVHHHASMLEERGFDEAAHKLRQLLSQKTDPLYDTDMREALRLHHLVKTGKLELTPPKDQTR